MKSPNPYFSNEELIARFERGSKVSECRAFESLHSDKPDHEKPKAPPGYWLTEKQCRDWINFAKYNFNPEPKKPKAERLLPRCPRNEAERMQAFDYLFHFSDHCYV